jgi:hypothetical protein
MEKNEIEITDFVTRSKKVIHLDSLSNAGDSKNGHGGGDHGLVHDFVRLVHDGQHASLTSATVAVQSHLMAFAAETSRLERRVVTMTEFRNSLHTV